MKYLLFSLFCCLLFSCSGDYSPKPSGYFRIDMEKPIYRKYADSALFVSFNIQQNSEIEFEMVPDTVNGNWFNIVYPALDAKISCSYLPINSLKDLRIASEESRKLVYVHAIKADDITEQSYIVPENKVYALIYDINGNVATPLQFVVTDSTHYFFRGSLYFNSVPNGDSIAPVKEYIRRDIEEMISSFRWKRE